jgi:glycosyltransferase involved in cell wall biosynthesis
VSALTAGVVRASESHAPLAGLRVLIVHEWLNTWAGSERCLSELLQVVPHAEVISGTITPEMRAREPIARRARETWLGLVPGARAHHRWFLPLHAAAFASIDTSAYDMVISLSHAFAKAVRARGRGVHFCYCISPPRYLWDLRDTYGRYAPLEQRLALAIGGAPLRGIDRWAAAGVHRFASISRFVADRVRRAYNRESDVVYPPVSAKHPAPRRLSASTPFLLSLGRLVSYKRVDLAIRAAERLQLKLVVAGDGPERERLERLAGPYTEFVGAVSEEEAGRLLSSCSAFVFCAEEDFGMTPLEANAHGAPVVAFARGATIETMVDGETGVLFSSQTDADVALAIDACLQRTWSVDALRANAARFSPDRFREAIAAQLVGTLTGPSAQ